MKPGDVGVTGVGDGDGALGGDERVEIAKRLVMRNEDMFSTPRMKAARHPHRL